MDANTAKIRRVDRPGEDPILVALDRLRTCPEELVSDEDYFWPPSKRKKSKKKDTSIEDCSNTLEEEDSSTGAHATVPAKSQTKTKQRRKNCRTTPTKKHSPCLPDSEVVTNSMKKTPPSEVDKPPEGKWTAKETDFRPRTFELRRGRCSLTQYYDI